MLRAQSRCCAAISGQQAVPIHSIACRSNLSIVFGPIDTGPFDSFLHPSNVRASVLLVSLQPLEAQWPLEWLPAVVVSLYQSGYLSVAWLCFPPLQSTH